MYRLMSAISARLSPPRTSRDRQPTRRTERDWLQLHQRALFAIELIPKRSYLNVLGSLRDFRCLPVLLNSFCYRFAGIPHTTFRASHPDSPLVSRVPSNNFSKFVYTCSIRYQRSCDGRGDEIRKRKPKLTETRNQETQKPHAKNPCSAKWTPGHPPPAPRTLENQRSTNPTRKLLTTRTREKSHPSKTKQNPQLRAGVKFAG